MLWRANGSLIYTLTTDFSPPPYNLDPNSLLSPVTVAGSPCGGSRPLESKTGRPKGLIQQVAERTQFIF
ncbi:MAG: hypothetical protein ABSC23_03535 [Bryobacteraceae bacterium]